MAGEKKRIDPDLFPHARTTMARLLHTPTLLLAACCGMAHAAYVPKGPKFSWE